MATRYSVELATNSDLAQPFVSGAKRKSLQNFRLYLKKLLSGAFTETVTLTVRNTAVRSTGTITLASCLANTVIEINGVPFTAKASTAVPSENRFSIDTDDTAAAVSLAAVINASTSTGISGVVTATSALGVVTLTSTKGGYGSNAITLKTLGVVATDAVTVSAVDLSDTLTINGQALTAIKQRATGTLTAVSCIAGTTCVVNGVTLTGVVGAVVLGAKTFSVDTGDTETATSLAAQINALTDGNVAGKITATSATNVVTLRSVAAGTVGNAYTLVGTVTKLAASAATLAGGIAVANNQFDLSPGATDTQVATDLARCINASTTGTISNYVRATSAAAVVTVYSKLPGHLGNTITCAGNDGDISAATARLAGGTQASWEGVQASATVTIAAGGSGNYTVTINGVAAASAINWNTDATTTAVDICTAIAASTNALVRGRVTATNTLGVITVTAVRGGITGNAISLAASGSAVTPSVSSAFLASGAVPTTVVLSGERMASGSESQFTLTYN